MKKKPKPLLIGAFNELKDTFILVATSPSFTYSNSPKKNEFGYHFERAAQETGAVIKYHYFDASVVEIRQSDMQLFIEYLHSSMIHY